jgi:PAS domain S-box-containing protein
MEVAKFRSQLSIALEHATILLRQWMHSEFARSITRGRRLVGETFHVGRSHLRRLVTLSRDVTVATNYKISRQAFIGLGQIAIHLARAQDKLLRLGKSVAGQPRKLEEAYWARENDLRELLANSPDAIVVTDANRRFIEANPNALVLFGVSEANLRKFTVDVFFSRGQIPKSEGSVSPFRTRYGRCEIRRLDGSLRVAECCFFANFIPFRHVYKFSNVIATNQYQPFTLRTLGTQSNHLHKFDLLH